MGKKRRKRKRNRPAISDDMRALLARQVAILMPPDASLARRVAHGFEGIAKELVEEYKEREAEASEEERETVLATIDTLTSCAQGLHLSANQIAVLREHGGYLGPTANPNLWIEQVLQNEQAKHAKGQGN